jgi:hypothetical protein
MLLRNRQRRRGLLRVIFLRSRGCIGQRNHGRSTLTNRQTSEVTLLRGKSANWRPEHLQQGLHKKAVHSITSSGRASSDAGTVRPSVFAVLRLMISSYLVGAYTGRSTGFSPLRMRST